MFRIRKLSLNFLGPDEDQPFLNPTTESATNSQLPSIVIEQPEGTSTTISNDNIELQPQTSSIINDNNDTAKL